MDGLTGQAAAGGHGPADPPSVDAAVLDALLARTEAIAAAHAGGRVLVGIAGPPGSGKTLLARSLVRALAGRDDWRGTRVAHVPMDGFHLADVELERSGRLGRKGAPDTFDVDGYRALLARIRAGEDVYAPDFDRTLDQPVAGSLPVTAATQIVVTEGNYLLLPDDPWPAVRSQLDDVWFVRVDPAARRRRLVERHVRYGRSPEQARAWVRTVDEPNARLVDAARTRADLVVDLP